MITKTFLHRIKNAFGMHFVWQKTYYFARVSQAQGEAKALAKFSFNVDFPKLPTATQ